MRLERHDFAAGAVARAHRQRLGGGAPAVGSVLTDGRVLTISTPVQPEWIDYNKHLTEWAYLKLFGDGTDVVLAKIGAGAEYVAGGHSWYTVETHIRHLGQARLGEPVEVRTRVLAADAKRLHLFHEMVSLKQNAVIATAEHMLVHVDAKAEKSAPAPGDAGCGAGARSRAGAAAAARWHGPPNPDAGLNGRGKEEHYRMAVIETRSIDYIPLAERHRQSARSVAALVHGGCASRHACDRRHQRGGRARPFWSSLAVIGGCALGTVLMALHCTQGPHLGLPQMIQSRPQFGYIGALLVSVRGALLLTSGSTRSTSHWQPAR